MKRCSDQHLPGGGSTLRHRVLRMTTLAHRHGLPVPPGVRLAWTSSIVSSQIRRAVKIPTLGRVEKPLKRSPSIRRVGDCFVTPPAFGGDVPRNDVSHRRFHTPPAFGGDVPRNDVSHRRFHDCVIARRGSLRRSNLLRSGSPLPPLAPSARPPGASQRPAPVPEGVGRPLVSTTRIIGATPTHILSDRGALTPLQVTTTAAREFGRSPAVNLQYQAHTLTRGVGGRSFPEVGITCPLDADAASTSWQWHTHSRTFWI